ncbi:hypothetical protein OG689_41655 [Kitasatospora sp. NBC_00240]|uniref:hypothetical protein n=1 Tax=Kitasatospora sp. NBC_00240 TaxID=2903567 RepID=UPI0022591520|nr:hypothetical protein [Kitasatospora sp. NBC_00240]MCX5215664.1 hypothetical protein [Kitasatospora sp. NBC_00240]
MSWDLTVGEHVGRDELHARYGGRTRGRISPCSLTPNVMLFTSPGSPLDPLDGWSLLTELKSMSVQVRALSASFPP